MKTLLAVLLMAMCGASRAGRSLQDVVSINRNTEPHLCDNDFIYNYRGSIYDFSLMLYKAFAESENYHFAHSSLSIWRTLAALAEGANQQFQHNMLKFLHLSTDPHHRQKYYDLIKSRIVQGDDKQLRNTRTLVYDDAVSVSKDWSSFVSKNSMLDFASAPMKSNPLIAANYIRQKMWVPLPKLNLNGDPIILDSIDYKPLWTTAFNDAVISHSPFYNLMGETIGAVDLMTMVKRVKMTYVPSIDLKILELPVGSDGRYRFWFCLFQSKTQRPSLGQLSPDLVFEMINDLKMTEEPVYIAIPRITMATNLDVMEILKKVGMPDMWTSPNATKFTLDPAALPTSFIQRTTVTFDTPGVNPATSECNGRDIDPTLEKFIANRPFLFGMYDAETYTCLMAGAYSLPTYV